MTLLNEQPIYIYPSLVKQVGVYKAIILEKLHQCLTYHGLERDGERWYCQPIYLWAQKLPFFSEAKIKRLIIELEKEEYIYSTTKFNYKQSDRTKWYRINYEKINSISIHSNVHLYTSNVQNNLIKINKNEHSYDKRMFNNTHSVPTTMLTNEQHELNVEQNKTIPESYTKNEQSSNTKDESHFIPIPMDKIEPNNIINNLNNKKEKKKINKKEKKKALAQEIITYLNEKANKRFNNKTDANLNMIIARLEDGYTVEDCKSVIDAQTALWLHDERMAQYLRPQTLFRPSKFDAYLSNAHNIKKAKTFSPELYEVVLDFDEDF